MEVWIISNPFTAAPSVLGYYYQARYALLLLLKSSTDSEISLESFDDISFEQNGTPLELIQTKHTSKTTGSLSDSSTDLWKTLRIWSATTMENKFLPSKTIFTLVTTAYAPNNSVASKLRPVETGTRNEKEALETLISVATLSQSQTNKKAYDTFMKLDKEKQYELLKSIRILDSSPKINNVKKEIMKELRLVVSEKFQNSLFTRLEGWWMDIVIKHLSKQVKDTISLVELRMTINDLQKQFVDDNLPIDFIDAIAPSEEELPEEQRIFIEQLRLVLITNPRIKLAISDYYRAYEQRSRWVREDLLLVSELGKYEKRLVEEWYDLFHIMKEDLGENFDDECAIHCGKMLYNKIRENVKISIRPHVTEPYVVRGSYHMLSNQLDVGWHVNFFEKLQSSLQPIQRGIR